MRKLGGIRPEFLVAWVAGLALSGCDLGVNFEDAFHFEDEPYYYDRPPETDAPHLVRAVQGYPESLRVRAWDPDGPPAVSLVADLSDLPPGNDARFILDTDSRVRGKLIWTPTAYDSGGYDVLFTATSGSRSETDTTVIYVTDHLSDAAPTVIAPTDTYAPDTVAFTFTAANFLSGSTTTRVMVHAPSEPARETPGPGGGPPPESGSRLSGLKR